MKNPNGYGSVCKLSGKRRKPYAAIKTTGWDDEGRQVRETIGYFETRAKAMQALAQYNVNPFDLADAGLTFAELFDKVAEKKFSKISKSNIDGYKYVFKICTPLHDLKFIDIKAAQLQKIIDECGKGHAARQKIKVLYNQIYKYALENDIVAKDYSKYVEAGEKTTVNVRKPFSASEVNFLWDNIERVNYIDTILIMIYSGLRPGELVLMENANIDTEARIMRGGIKTEAGKNRIIPINKKILSLIEARMQAGHKYLVVSENGSKLSYNTYYKSCFVPIMQKIGFNHKPHDCRHTFATLMDNAGANNLSIKRIMGHASKDITDSIYKHKNVEELLKAVDMI